MKSGEVPGAYCLANLHPVQQDVGRYTSDSFWATDKVRLGLYYRPQVPSSSIGRDIEEMAATSISCDLTVFAASRVRVEAVTLTGIIYC